MRTIFTLFSFVRDCLLLCIFCNGFGIVDIAGTGQKGLCRDRRERASRECTHKTRMSTLHQWQMGTIPHANQMCSIIRRLLHDCSLNLRTMIFFDTNFITCASDCCSGTCTCHITHDVVRAENNVLLTSMVRCPLVVAKRCATIMAHLHWSVNGHHSLAHNGSTISFLRMSCLAFTFVRLSSITRLLTRKSFERRSAFEIIVFSTFVCTIYHPVV